MKNLLLIILSSLIILLFVLSGCNGIAQSDPSILTAAIETIEALATVNTASTPVNPYVFPVGVGLSGIIAMLEALRRKEKSSRKHAEGKLNNGGNTT